MPRHGEANARFGLGSLDLWLGLESVNHLETLDLTFIYFCLMCFVCDSYVCKRRCGTGDNSVRKNAIHQGVGRNCTVMVIFRKDKIVVLFNVFLCIQHKMTKHVSSPVDLILNGFPRDSN